MAHNATASSSRPRLEWRPTKIMNMKDLSKDDDFLSHLLVEKLGTGQVPLAVHKMDPTRRLPKTDAQDLLNIVRRKQINAFATCVHSHIYLPSPQPDPPNSYCSHASRYLELYNPQGIIEIAHTSRYSHRTGKSELCILATRNLAPGTVITELKGSMANLTDEEDRELKRTDLRSSDIRRDFSVIHSKQMKKNHLFLGPARFVNHDCDNNCELFREGRYITFRTLRAISIGEEITAHYGDGYFGRKNRHCLCESCEKAGRGGYSPETDDSPSSSSDSDSDSDSDSNTSSSDSENDDLPKPALDLNERRTRRGVYAIVTKKENDSEDSEDDDEEDDSSGDVPLANARDVPGDGEIELSAEMDTPSDLTSLATSSVPPPDLSIEISFSSSLSSLTPDSRRPSSSSSLSSLSSPGDSISTPKRRGSFRSIISTRRQREKEIEAATATQLVTPPLSEDTASLPEVSTPRKRVTRSKSALELSKQTQAPNKGNGKAKGTSSTPAASASSRGTTIKDDIKIKKEEVEQRSLRVRPSTVNIADVSREPPSKPEVPRGPDGKPLPTCVTCTNVLPVISVDSQVVWGLDSPKKKKGDQECPRCIRHCAIYGRPWPCRIPLQGLGFLPTPREDDTLVESASSRISHKALSVLDRKLAAAASSSLRVRKRESDSVERPGPAKRRKTKPIQREVAAKATKPLFSSKNKDKGPRIHRLPDEVPDVKVKGQMGEQVETTKPQPRNLNGRFEKKVRVPKKADATPSISTATNMALSSRAERALERQKARYQGDEEEEEENGGTWTSPRRKRSINELDLQELPNKRPYRRREQPAEPPRRVIPHPVTHFKGGRLTSNPNPLSFAIQAWAGPPTFDDSSEDEKAPVTPQDIRSPPAAMAEADVDGVATMAITAAPRAALTFKPSPFTFAKRRWTSSSSSHTPDGSSKSPQSDHDSTPPSPRRTNIHTSAPVKLVSINARAGPSNPRKSDIGLMYSSDEDYPSGRLIPVLGASDVSSDDEHGMRLLRHSYPDSHPPFHPDAPVSFVSVQGGPAPNFIHAGWGSSCSSESEA
ncbi:hypothetical protein DXG03_003141 [Asterophora parasitica]|uniref:SET domain-containing protein n=1 Tax=Asterophora parasitica TaxID=117018 RepID=A0A9P7GFT2_9AGAR|nr:hypothetical protein DXG03_003141 [Asterophora parasitica]